jgi:hypothetical protein
MPFLHLCGLLNCIVQNNIDVAVIFRHIKLAAAILVHVVDQIERKAITSGEIGEFTPIVFAQSLPGTNPYKTFRILENASHGISYQPVLHSVCICNKKLSACGKRTIGKYGYAESSVNKTEKVFIQLHSRG